jgi:hypothetical protein
MKLLATALMLVLFSLPAFAQSENGSSHASNNGKVDLNLPDPPMLGVQWAREAKPVPGGTSPNMTWHNGAIMPSASATAIFWGTSWGSSSFVGDKITGLDTWYNGVGGSKYAATSTEYTGFGGQVTSSVTYNGHYIDLSSAPNHAPSTSAVLNEVCKVISVNKLTIPSNNYYAVYVDGSRRGANYCAWHSYGACNGTPVQFGFFFNLDGDAGCDPQDASGIHSQGLAALSNVTGHELAEAVTDPRNGGWWDSSGQENADKCAWTFGAPLLTFTNGSQWKIQGNWSNQAYTAETGYANSKGQKGCLSGF